jgi:hypothetical protein
VLSTCSVHGSRAPPQERGALRAATTVCDAPAPGASGFQTASEHAWRPSLSSPGRTGSARLVARRSLPRLPSCTLSSDASIASSLFHSNKLPQPVWSHDIRTHGSSAVYMGLTSLRCDGLSRSRQINALMCADRHGEDKKIYIRLCTKKKDELYI